MHLCADYEHLSQKTKTYIKYKMVHLQGLKSVVCIRGGGGEKNKLNHENASRLMNRPVLRMKVIVSVKINLLETEL